MGCGVGLFSLCQQRSEGRRHGDGGVTVPVKVTVKGSAWGQRGDNGGLCHSNAHPTSVGRGDNGDNGALCDTAPPGTSGGGLGG